METRLIKLLAIFFILFSLTACTRMWQDVGGLTGISSLRRGVSSSLVDYLYPSGEIPPEHDTNIPNLNLPLKVGLAFVPASSINVEGLSEAHKTELLENVKKSFEGREFIREIMTIPDTYMRSGRGFKGVDQIARLYGLDIIALVSYDQVAHADDTKASILYWTILGAYFLKGSKNDVQTFVDTAILDINTRKLLFRAPGVNKIQATSTLIKSTEEMRTARAKSFTLSMSDMVQNLDKELDTFKERIKKDKSVTITHHAGYGGGGAFGCYGILLLLIILFAKYRIASTRRDS